MILLDRCAPYIAVATLVRDRTPNIHLMRRQALRHISGAQPKGSMMQLLRFPTAVKRDPAIEVWIQEHPGELGKIAQRWFQIMRDCGDDVRELLHDGHSTACIGDAAFGYVNVFNAHVNVGFVRGAHFNGEYLGWSSTRMCSCRHSSFPAGGAEAPLHADAGD